MDEFVLIFRQPTGNDLPTPEQLKSMMPLWNSWLEDLTSQGKLIPGKRLAHDGKVLRTSGLVTDGPFVEIKEQLGGFVSVKAEHIDDAVTLAHGCPILNIGGSVEVRLVIPNNA